MENFSPLSSKEPTFKEATEGSNVVVAAWKWNKEHSVRECVTHLKANSDFLTLT